MLTSILLVRPTVTTTDLDRLYDDVTYNRGNI